MPFSPCKNCWCSLCYKPIGGTKFPIRENHDDDGNILVDPTGSNRFKEDRNGDHLMVPFQCELCHFRKMFGQEPCRSNPKDQEVFAFVRRANLDCF